MTNKLKTLAFALIAVLMAACTGSHDGDVRSDLLGFVPDKTPVVISVNPQKMLQSAGGDWTEADGIVFGPYIDDCIKKFARDEYDDVKSDIDKFIKEVRGLNPQSIIIASNNNLRSWFMLGAVSDKQQLMKFVEEKTDKEFETSGDFEVLLKRGSCVLIDNSDNLLWVLDAGDADDAVRKVKNLKSLASDKAMPKWTHKYLGSGDNYLAAVGNFGAMGVNLNGLIRMLDVPADLLGGEIAYMAFAAGEDGHKATGELVTLGEDGENVPLLNKSFYKSADLSAWNLLPEGCNSKVALGINGKEVLEYLPMLRKAMDNPMASDIIGALQSVAFGVGSVDYNAVEALSTGGNITELPVKNGALVAKFAPGKSAELMKLIADNLPQVVTVDNNTLKMEIKNSGVRGLDAVYVRNQDNALIISVENLKTGHGSESLPSDALAYSYADSKIYGGSNFAFASEMLKSAKGYWDEKGLYGETEYTDKCPGMLAFMCKFVSAYADEMMRQQQNRLSYDDYDDIVVDSIYLDEDDIVVEEVPVEEVAVSIE